MPEQNPSEVASQVENDQPIEVSQQSTSHSSKSKTPLIVLGLLLLAVGLAGAVYFYQKQPASSPGPLVKTPDFVHIEPTSVDTSAWKTYSNPTLGFSLKHPPEYVSEEELTSQQVIFKAESGDVEISSFVVATSPEKIPEFPFDQPPTGSFTLAGVEGVYVELPEGYGDGGNFKPQPQLSVFAERNDKTYQINFGGVSSIKDPTVVQILSTFKFTDTTVQNTYTDSTYNFQFSYSSDGVLEKTENASRYLRVENFVAQDDKSNLAAGEYYLELYIDDPEVANRKNILSSCNELIADGTSVQLGAITGLRGKGVEGADAGGHAYATCAEDSGKKYLIVVTESSSEPLIAKGILDSFKFTQ